MTRVVYAQACFLLSADCTTLSYLALGMLHSNIMGGSEPRNKCVKHSGNQDWDFRHRHSMFARVATRQTIKPAGLDMVPGQRQQVPALSKAPTHCNTKPGKATATPLQGNRAEALRTHGVTLSTAHYAQGRLQVRSLQARQQRKPHAKHSHRNAHATRRNQTLGVTHNAPKYLRSRLQGRLSHNAI